VRLYHPAGPRLIRGGERKLPADKGQLPAVSALPHNSGRRTNGSRDQSVPTILSVLAMLLVPSRLAPVMLGATGMILVFRGLLGAVFSLRRG